MDLFGFTLKRSKKETDEEKRTETVVVETVDDGSTIMAGGGGHYGYSLDIDGSIKNEDDAIAKYRDASFYSDCDSAIEDIVNEAICSDEDERSIDIVLDNLKLPDNIKKKISEEFDNILHLLEFDIKGSDIFRQWYVDGRLYYHVIVDPKREKEGILKLIYVDSRKIRKIKNIKKKKTNNGVDVIEKTDEHFVYNPKGLGTSTQGIKMSLDSVVYVPSGHIDSNTGMALSYLHKAIKPVNQLKMIEDAFVIYTVSRAPQRRVFYIDVGNMPKLKAEQYITEIMNKFRNKIVYDAKTGEVRDSKKNMSILEDFWMPRKEGGKGTEITTLSGGDSLINNESMQYFQRKLFQALNVPIGRLQPDQGFNLGKSSEITRDELKFNKFITKIRRKFAVLFYELLRLQLLSKQIMSPDDWEECKKDIRFDFRKDNFFTEFKNSEIISARATLLQQIEPYLGRFYSINWARRNVLHQSEEEIKEIDKEMADEDKQGLYDIPEEDQPAPKKTGD